MDLQDDCTTKIPFYLVDRGRFAVYFKSTGDQWDRLKDLYLKGKKFYSYYEPKPNYRCRFVKDFVVDEKQYEVEKQNFINKFLMQEPTTKRQGSYERLIYCLIRFGSFKQKEVAEMANITSQTISYIKIKIENSGNIPEKPEFFEKIKNKI